MCHKGFGMPRVHVHALGTHSQRYVTRTTPKNHHKGTCYNLMPWHVWRPPPRQGASIFGFLDSP